MFIINKNIELFFIKIFAVGFRLIIVQCNLSSIKANVVNLESVGNERPLAEINSFQFKRSTFFLSYFTFPILINCACKTFLKNLQAEMRCPI